MMNDRNSGYKNRKNPTLPWPIPGSNYPDLSSGSIIRSTSGKERCDIFRFCMAVCLYAFVFPEYSLIEGIYDILPLNSLQTGLGSLVSILLAPQAPRLACLTH